MGNVLIAAGIPGGASETDYSAYGFDGKGSLVMPDTPGFRVRLK